jgi:acyl-CoA reductase-like NAD-dependent aldehyde dehydrogenase
MAPTAGSSAIRRSASNSITCYSRAPLPPAEVDDAVAAVRRTLEVWNDIPVTERVQPLFRYESLVEDS